MIVSLSIASVVVLSFGYIGIFQPHLVSGNIVPLTTQKSKICLYSGFVLLAIGLLGLLFPNSYLEWVSYLFVIIFLLIACIDGYSKIIPNLLVLFAFFLGALQFASDPNLEVILSLLSVITLGLILIVAQRRLDAKKYIGWGDIKLISAIAFFTGWEFLIILYIGVVIAGVYTLIGLASGKLHKSSQIPLAPFLYASYLITLVYNIDLELIIIFFKN